MCDISHLLRFLKFLQLKVLIKSDFHRDCIWTTAWGYLTYSLLHVGAGHMIFNLVLQFGIGLGLEMVHGTISVMILYVLGVSKEALE